MSPFATVAIAAIGAFLAWFVVSAIRYSIKAGPAELPPEALARARAVRRLEAGGREAWDSLGKATVARGLDLRFDHDDDPRAQAWLLLPEAPRQKPGTLGAQARTVTLSETFDTYHVHSMGHVFRIEMRGTGGAVGKEVRLHMWHERGGVPYGATISNDDDYDGPVGQWIEVRSAELLKVQS